MTLLADREGAAHGFGAPTPRAARSRAAVGGTVSTALVVGALCAVGLGGPLLLLVAGAGVVGTLASWLLERGRPSSWPEARYGAVGVALALAVLLALGWSDPGFLLAVGFVALPAGAAGGAVAGLVAARLPARLLPGAACLGVAVLAGSGVVAVQRMLPPLPGSYLLVEGPSTAGSAGALAGRVAAGLRAQPDPLSDAAWAKVAASVVTPLEGGRTSIGYARTAAGRRITVLASGQRACVDVRRDRVDTYAGTCRQP
ncbi:MAG: hypothetical protein JWN17_728 [Frankiales bacterium]|nr:hypothetical protein [Frankiales bacterium]